jgi:hypothetical protein
MMEGLVEEVVRSLFGSGGAASSLLLLVEETWNFAAAGVEEHPKVGLAEPFKRGIRIE